MAGRPAYLGRGARRLIETDAISSSSLWSSPSWPQAARHRLATRSTHRRHWDWPVISYDPVVWCIPGQWLDIHELPDNTVMKGGPPTAASFSRFSKIPVKMRDVTMKVTTYAYVFFVFLAYCSCWRDSFVASVKLTVNWQSFQMFPT